MKTIGEFYREKILSQKNLIKKELPSGCEPVKIEKDLFGWKLYAGTDFIECDSEEDARYLKVFLESNMREVYIPSDKEYLKEILPELEKIKIKIDEIMNSYLCTVLNKKAREKVKYEVFMEITK